MKKILLLFALLLLFVPMAIGEVIPPRGTPMTKETHPLYWSYFENYANNLQKALESKKMFRLRGMGASYNYIVTCNGEIKDMEISTYQNKYFNEKVKEIIMSVDPEPFYSGMNSENIYFTVYLGYESYNDKRISIGWALRKNKKNVHISIITSR